MLREGEDGDPDVREDEVLGHEVEEAEKLLRRRPRLRGHVVVGVVRLTDAAEQDGHDAGQTENLSDQEPVQINVKKLKNPSFAQFFKQLLC